MAMIEVSSRWNNIGVHFFIQENVRADIRNRARHDFDNCLTYLIVEWLTNCNGPPTWRKVAIAVSSRVGGDNPVAAKAIARDYKGKGYACT